MSIIIYAAVYAGIPSVLAWCIADAVRERRARQERELLAWRSATRWDTSAAVIPAADVSGEWDEDAWPEIARRILR